MFVVAGHGHARQHGLDETAGLVPLAPLDVAVGVVDEIACVDHEARVGRVLIGGSDGARPVRAEVVLRVAEVDERHWLRLIAGGAGMEPLAPVLSVAHPVGIERIGHQTGEGRRMVMRGDVLALNLRQVEQFCRGFDRLSLGVERRLGTGEGDLRDSLVHGWVGAPGDAQRCGRILRPGERDAIGIGCRLFTGNSICPFG